MYDVQVATVANGRQHRLNLLEVLSLFAAAVACVVLCYFLGSGALAGGVARRRH